MGKKKVRAAVRSSVAEYLNGGISHRELAKKYGVNNRAVGRWIAA
jgi:transposase-like protein